MLLNFDGRLSWNQFSWEKNVALPMQLFTYFKKAWPTFCCTLNGDFVFCDRFNFQECGQAL